MANPDAAARRSRLIRIAKYWLPVAVMFALMLTFSTDLFSADNTRAAIRAILRWILGGEPRDHSLARGNLVVRKLTHVAVYAVLAALLFRAFRADSVQRWSRRWLVQSGVVLAIWASIDELLQMFTSSRSGSAWDVLLDMAGGAAALGIIAVISRKNLDADHADIKGG